MSYIDVRDDMIAVSKGLHVNYFDYKNHTVFKVSNDLIARDDDLITDIAISYDKKLLALLLSTSKRLILYELPSFKCIQNKILPRSASKIRFGVENDQIFVADKTGDVLLYMIYKEDNGTKLLGHLSLLLNVLQTSDGKYIITSDRDEKIKVSCYPNTYNIQTYCLGHKEFVNHIELLPHNSNYLTSASGDGSIQCWNYLNGQLLHKIDTSVDIESEELKNKFSKSMDEEGIEVSNLPIVHYSIIKINESSSLIAVAIHSYMKILVYNLQTNNEKFTHNLIVQLSIENFPAGIKFNQQSLYIYDNVVSRVTEYKIINNNCDTSIEFDKNIDVFKDEGVSNENYDQNAIKVLFKRKFDNVQEYQERKKQRLGKNNA